MQSLLARSLARRVEATARVRIATALNRAVHSNGPDEVHAQLVKRLRIQLCRSEPRNRGRKVSTALSGTLFDTMNREMYSNDKK